MGLSGLGLPTQDFFLARSRQPLVARSLVLRQLSRSAKPNTGGCFNSCVNQVTLPTPDRRDRSHFLALSIFFPLLPEVPTSGLQYSFIGNFFGWHHMFQFLTKLDYLLRETFLGLRRGGWMNWAAVSTVTVLLFLFGMSLQASWQLEGLLGQFGGQLEVAVYLDPGARIEMVKPVVEQLPQVTDVQVISKEQAWEFLVEELGISDIAAATEQLEGNPLVDELKVKARTAAEVPELAEQLGQIPGIDEVQYVDEAIQRLQDLKQGLGWVSLTITSVLCLTAVAVIATTIRLIVMARRREIEIMQLVGATSAWIYFPFILQGITFGVVGAAIAWGLVTSIQQFLANLLADAPEFLRFLGGGLQPNLAQLFLLPVLLLGFGGFVGLMGSLFAVRRFATR
jgi:cell division transport system permease protein